MDPSQNLTVGFNQFNANPNAGLGFFEIFNNSTNAFVTFYTFNPDQTSITITGNTLQQGTQYKFGLFFTTTGGPPNSNELLEVNSETTGLFTTAGGAAAVPEPSAWTTGLLGFAGLLAYRKMRR